MLSPSFDSLLTSSFIFFPFAISFSLVIISRDASDACDNLAVPSSRVGECSQIADGNATSNARATDTKIDRGVTSRSAAEYKTLYADILDARQLGVRFSDGVNSFIFGRRNVYWDSEIGAWNRRLPFLRKQCPETMKDVLGFNLPIICHVEETGYLRRLLRLVWSIDASFEYRGLALC